MRLLSLSLSPEPALTLSRASSAVCRPVLNQYVHTRDEFQTYSTELFKLVQEGALKLAVHGEYELTTEGMRQTQIDISASPRPPLVPLGPLAEKQADALPLPLCRPAASRKTSGKLLVKVA